MKLLMYSIALFLCAAGPTSAMAQNNKESADTLIVANNAENITVTKTDSGLQINIKGYGEKHESNYTYRSSSLNNDSTESGLWNLKLIKVPSPNPKWKVLCMEQFYLGGTIDLDGPIDMAYWRSVEVGISNVVGIKYIPWKKGPQFSIGAGIGYRHISTHKDTETILMRQPDGNLTLQPAPTYGINHISAIDIMHFDIPLMITQPINKFWSFTIGASVNFNTYVTASTHYKLLGENDFELPKGYKVEETYKHLRQNPVTFDFLVSIGVTGGIGIYARYSPMPVFKDGAGPKFKTLSIGLSAGF